MLSSLCNGVAQGALRIAMHAEHTSTAHVFDPGEATKLMIFCLRELTLIACFYQQRWMSGTR